MNNSLIELNENSIQVLNETHGDDYFLRLENPLPLLIEKRLKHIESSKKEKEKGKVVERSALYKILKPNKDKSSSLQKPSFRMGGPMKQRIKHQDSMSHLSLTEKDIRRRRERVAPMLGLLNTSNINTSLQSFGVPSLSTKQLSKNIVIPEESSFRRMRRPGGLRSGEISHASKTSRKKVLTVHEKVTMFKKYHDDIKFTKKKNKLEQTLSHLEKIFNVDLLFQAKWRADSVTSIMKNFPKPKQELMMDELKKLAVIDQLRAVVLVNVDKILEQLEACLSKINRTTISQFFFEEYFITIMRILSELKIPYLALNLLLFISEVYLKLKYNKGAKEILENLCALSDLFGEYRILMKAKEKLGFCLRELKNHEEALKCFKLQVQLAWIFKSREYEIRGYDNIGVQYFYLNEIEAATKYHQFSIQGNSQVENEFLMKVTHKRFKEEKEKKHDMLRTKNSYFPYETLARLLRGEHDWKLSSLSKVLELNLGLLEDSFIKAMPASSKPRIRLPDVGNLKSSTRSRKQYTCSFTKDGYENYLMKSNPIKYQMLKEGIIDMDMVAIQNVKLYDNIKDFNGKQMFFMHQSQNKAAESFLGYHNFSKNNAEICLEFITTDIRYFMIQALKEQKLEMQTYKNYLSEYFN